MNAAVANLIAALKLKLAAVPNWRKVLKHSWSPRFAALSFVLSMLEVAFPYLDGVLPVERGTFGLLVGLTTGASMLARIVAQNAVSGAPAVQGAE